jgi:hypothetical protein
MRVYWRHDAAVFYSDVELKFLPVIYTFFLSSGKNNISAGCAHENFFRGCEIDKNQHIPSRNVLRREIFVP